MFRILHANHELPNFGEEIKRLSSEIKKLQSSGAHKLQGDIYYRGEIDDLMFPVGIGWY